MTESIEVPFALLEKVVEAGQAFQRLEDEIEDYLISKDEVLLERLKKARKDHLEGKVQPFSEIRRTK